MLLAFVTIALIIVVQVWGRGFIKSIAVLIGLVGGTILAAFLGLVDLSPVGQATWFHFPQPFYFGKPTFDLSSIVLMIIISMDGHDLAPRALGEVANSDFHASISIFHLTL